MRKIIFCKKVFSMPSILAGHSFTTRKINWKYINEKLRGKEIDERWEIFLPIWHQSCQFPDSSVIFKKRGLDGPLCSKVIARGRIRLWKRKNLYNVLLALAFVFLWLYYREEMWRMCDRFLKRKWKFLTENSIKGKLFI